VAAGISRGASAASGLQQFVGWEGDTRGQGYGFVGTSASLSFGRHVAFPVSASASFLYYGYDSAATSVLVRSPGASLMTGVRVAGARESATLLMGYEMRWEWREVGGSGGSMRSRQVLGGVVQTYDDLSLGRRWYLSGFGVYVGGAEYLIGRGAIRCQLTNLDWKASRSFFMGMEAVRQGNDNSDGLQVGGFVEWNLAPKRITLGLHSGYKESWSPGYPHQPGGYFGVSFYRF
jgi:cellulose biosynthesis protein BcsS